MSHEQNTWIFQANPNYYNIYESLRLESEDSWNCRQHTSKIKVGDRVLIWVSGKEAGVYAIGKVTSEAEHRSDSAIGMKYWTNPLTGAKEYPRVWVEYEKILLDRPLLKKFIIWDPDLDNLKILANPRGTNFPVTQTEWSALENWLSE